MKAWKKLHYDRASAFLSVLTGGAPAVTPPVEKSTSTAASAGSPPAIAAPVETVPTSVVIEPPANPATETATGMVPPLVKVLPTETAPIVHPAATETQPPAAKVEADAPVKITPLKSVSERAPKEAGKFFSGIAWAGGEASFDAASEPDAKPGISVQPIPESESQGPPDRANPILAATRSALVTAEKASTPAPAETDIDQVKPDALPASDDVSPTAPASETTPVDTQTGENAATFFKNLNWKNN